MSGLNTPCNSVPAPVSLPPLYLDQEHFLIPGQSLASGQLLVVPVMPLGQEITREVKRFLFTGKLQNYMKLGYLCFLKIFCHRDVILLFRYMVLKVCFSARLTHLSWENVNAVHPDLCPSSLSHFWSNKKHLAELCQEIMWAFPSEIMPSE